MGEVEPSETIKAEQFLSDLKTEMYRISSEINDGAHDTNNGFTAPKLTHETEIHVVEEINLSAILNLTNFDRTKSVREIIVKNVTFKDTSLMDSINHNMGTIHFVNCSFNLLFLKEVQTDNTLIFDNCQIELLEQSNKFLNFGKLIFCKGTKIARLKIDGDMQTTSGNELCGVWVFKDVIINQAYSLLEIKNVKVRDRLEFRNCDFNCAPNFSGSTLNHQTIFLNCKFKDLSAKSIACYRYLRSEMQRLNNHREADMFSSLEMEAYHKNNLSKDELTSSEKLEKFFSCLYSLFSNYGRDMTRPLIWIFATFLVFWLFLSFWFVDLTPDALQNPSSLAHYFIENGNLPSRRLAAFIQSLWNTLGPIGLFKTLSTIDLTSPFAPILIFIQKLISSTMWFLWLLQIRRRFKLS